MLFRQNKAKEGGNLDNSQTDVVKRRTKTTVIAEISLKPEQIRDFEIRLEELCNEFLNMRDDEVPLAIPGVITQGDTLEAGDTLTQPI